MTATKFVEAALAACGYRALPGLASTYGNAVGYPAQPWDGSFVTVTAQSVGLDVPMTATNTGITLFSRTRRMFVNPKPGDIVFFAFSANGQFGQPHVGIVTDTEKWRSEGTFRAVEAQVASGLPKSSGTEDGVFERTRYKTDVIGFGRPKFRVSENRRRNLTAPEITLRQIQYGKTNSGIERVQEALAKLVPLTGATRGKFDNQTKSAYSDYQRLTGMVGTDANGVPDRETLRTLAERTGLFTVKE